jgi:(2Fe-2S) ferredoxin
MDAPTSPLPSETSPRTSAAGPIPVSHHLLLCATPSKALCCPDPAVGAASWDALKRLVRELGLEDPARPGGIVLRSKADCLRICTEGPVLLIWPDGIVYGGVTPERIERILRQHVIAAQPIEPWIVRRYGLAQPASVS